MNVIAFAPFALAAAAATPAPYAGHGASSVSNETIARYAPAPLAPEVRSRIERMLDVRSPGSGQLTPDGRRLFFGWSITGTPAVWRLDGPTEFPVQMTGGDDRTTIVDITPDGRYLVLQRDRGGQEDPGLYLQSVDGGALTPIQHKPRTRAFYALTTADSRSVYFVSNDRKPDSQALYRYDIATGHRETVFTEDGLWSVADYREAEGGLTLLMRKAIGAQTAEIFELSVPGGTLKPLLGQGESTEYQVRYSPDPKELFVRTDTLGEFQRLYRWSADGGFRPVTADVAMDVADFAIDHGRKRLYYNLNDRGRSRLSVLDARTLEELKVPSFKDADQVGIGNTTRDGRFATLSVSGPRLPPTSYVYDWQTAVLTQWVRPNAPEVDVSRFAAVHLDTYPARDGAAIPMFVRYPEGCGPDAPATAAPCPIVAEFHGGPEGQARSGFGSRAQLFVDAGFIHVLPNVRGSLGYGKSWQHADDGPRRLAVITDIEDCGRYLREHFTRGGRAPKVGILGGSYGGYSTLMGMTRFAGTYDAGVSIVGMSNLLTFLQNTAPYRRTLRASEYGDPEKDRDALLELSPITYLERVKAPLLLIQGLDDPRVPVGEAVQMHQALEARGAPSRLLILPGEGHGAVRRAGEGLILGHALTFFEEHLLGRKAAATKVE